MKVAMLIPDNRDEFRRHADPEPQFGPAPTALLEGLAQHPECEVHVVCCVQKPVRAPANLAPNIFYHARLVPKWGWLRGGYLGCMRAVRAELRVLRPDLVHGQGTERYCALAAARSGWPNLTTIHGNMRALARLSRARPFSFAWLAARLEGMTLPRAGGVMCNSRHTQNLVAPLARQTWLVPNAVQMAFFGPPAGPPASPPVILNVGTVLPNKRQLDVLQMGRQLARAGRRFQLRFLGRCDESTTYGASFAREVQQARAEGWADHGGEVPTAELVRELDSASALVHVPAEEAFGLVVAEALARNLKFFGAHVGGVPDIAGGVQGAELFPPEDEAGLAAALSRWLAAGAPRPTTAADEMRIRFHPEVVALRHLEIYRELLAERGAGSG